MKWFSAEEGYRTRDLIQAGLDHLASAKVLFRADFRCFDSAGYLGHLGIELLLKSLLLHAQGKFPDEHSLTKLKAGVVATLPRYQLALPEEIVRTFDRFKRLRYPSPSDPPGIGTSDWPALESAVEAIAGAAPPEWIAEMNAIESNKKGGRILMVKDVLGSGHKAQEFDHNSTDV